jgi:hypothetical protein
VDIADPVYRVIDICSMRGVIGPLSGVKPYSRRDIRGYIEKALLSRERFSAAEAETLEGMLRRLSDGTAAVWLNAAGGSDFRADISNPQAMHSSSTMEGEAGGRLGGGISYRVSLTGFLDKVDPRAYAPYTFTKLWDGFHVWSENDRVLVSDGINGHLNFGYSIGTELTADILDGAGSLSLSRQRREWGPGEGSLSLSETARPMEALSGRIGFAPWGTFHFLIGNLGDWWNAAREQKMLSLHRLELLPAEWLSLSAWESVVWAKRLELSYLDPLMSYFFGQQISGDLDNVALGGDVGVAIAPFARLYISVFIDEISFVPLETFFTRANNQYAWQIGAKAPLPLLPWAMVSLQYTKIEPYCYTHYEQSLPQYTVPIDISYTNDAENIGYHLPPNSDELLFRLSALPLDGLSVTAQYQLIRHGTGNHLLGQIEGDVNAPIDYTSPVPYPLKSFLSDGIYEWINAVTLGLSFALPWLDGEVRAQYAFVSSTNSGNVTGRNVVQNLVELGLTVRTAGP